MISFRWPVQHSISTRVLQLVPTKLSCCQVFSVWCGLQTAVPEVCIDCQQGPSVEVRHVGSSFHNVQPHATHQPPTHPPTHSATHAPTLPPTHPPRPNQPILLYNTRRYFPGPYDAYIEAKAAAAVASSRQAAALDKQKAALQASITAAEKQARQVSVLELLRRQTESCACCLLLRAHMCV